MLAVHLPRRFIATIDRTGHRVYPCLGRNPDSKLQKPAAQAVAESDGGWTCGREAVVVSMTVARDRNRRAKPERKEN